MCWWPCFLMDGVFTFVVLCIDYYQIFDIILNSGLDVILHIEDQWKSTSGGDYIIQVVA